MLRGKTPGKRGMRRCSRTPMRATETQQQPQGQQQTSNKNNVAENSISPLTGSLTVYGISKKKVRSRSANCKPNNGTVMRGITKLQGIRRDSSMESENKPREIIPVKKKGSLCCSLDERDVIRNVQYQLPTSPVFNRHGRRYKDKDFTEVQGEEKTKTITFRDASNSTSSLRDNQAYVLRKEIHDWKVHEALTNKVESLLNGIETTKNSERHEFPRTSARSATKTFDKSSEGSSQNISAKILRCGGLLGNSANMVARRCGDVTQAQLEARTREQPSVTYIGEKNIKMS